MVSRQVVTIHTDGSVSGLQRKPGQGFDLRCLGKATITRASEIVWSEDHQMWYVVPVGEKFTDMLSWRKAFDSAAASLAGLERLPAGCQYVRVAAENVVADVVMAKEYDDAVAFEIAVLDGLRLKGKLGLLS